jgi:hypothetical protein
MASMHAALFFSILPLSLMAITMGPPGLMIIAVSLLTVRVGCMC